MKRNLFLILIFLLASVSAAAAEPVSFFVTEREEHIYTADKSTELVKCYYQNAVIKSAGDPAAVDRINDTLAALENKMMNDCRASVIDQENILADITEQGEEWRPMFVLELRSELTAQRADDRLISFHTLDYMFSGGAHGMYGINGMTFNALTGDRITFADLSYRQDALRESCVGEIVRQCLTRENLWWDNENDLRPVIERIVDRDSWYLTDEGIVFHSSPYELAPYSEGALEFLVPYSLLSDLRY